jgi:hypothetical protein
MPSMGTLMCAVLRYCNVRSATAAIKVFYIANHSAVGDSDTRIGTNSTDDGTAGVAYRDVVLL